MLKQIVRELLDPCRGTHGAQGLSNRGPLSIGELVIAEGGQRHQQLRGILGQQPPRKSGAGILGQNSSSPAHPVASTNGEEISGG